MDIIYMISEANSAPISINQDIRAEKPRYKDLTKTDIAQVCWLSYQHGIDKNDTIHLLCAEVTDELKEWLISTTEAKVIITDVLAIDKYDHPYSSYCDIRINNFIPQYEYFMDYVTKHPNNIYYLVNDDYLHVPDAVVKIKQLYNTGYDGFFVPHDYPDCYTDKTRNTDIFLTQVGYLRKIKSATPTLVAPGKLWLKYKYDILKAGVFADDGWTWRAFGLDLALSPMPGWSTHLQDGLESPYIDWYAMAKEYLREE